MKFKASSLFNNGKTMIILFMLMIVPSLMTQSCATSWDNQATRKAVVASPKVFPEPKATNRVQVKEAYMNLPLSFEINQGQTAKEVKFLSRGSGYTMFLTQKEAVLSLIAPMDKQSGERALNEREKEVPKEINASVLRMEFIDANPVPMVTGLEEMPGQSNYITGNDPKKWKTNIPNYVRVRYEEIYPGVDLIFYGNQGQMEYDFVLSPDADPGSILLGFEGADKIEIDQTGALVLHMRGGQILNPRPFIYQEVDGKRNAIDGSYVLTASNQVGFQVAAYDHNRPLVIDPVLQYSTYLGGSNIDNGYGIAVDSNGNAYVTGQTGSADFPTLNPFQGHGGTWDVFVTKFNSSGSALVYSTYLGGSLEDHGRGIAVDTNGNAYVTGYTWSTDFPTSNPCQGTYGGGGYDAFVTKFNASGSALAYSTFLGGSGLDQGHGIAVDTNGNAYVTGYTDSSNFPTSNPYQGTYGGGGNDVFVTKFNSSGALAYSTYLGGSGYEYSAGGIAVDSNGDAYVTGTTYSTDFPTLNPYQGTHGGSADVFVTKFNSSGSALDYSTFLGGSGNDNGRGIAVDTNGNAYVTGYTGSSNFPTLNPYQGTYGGGVHDVFVTRFNSSGSALAYSTYLGGSSYEYGRGIAVDTNGNAYVTGTTNSTDFPTSNPYQGTFGGGTYDVFVTRFNSSGSALAYSTYLGGSGDDRGRGIAVDSNGDAYVTGTTYSTDFPTSNPYQGTFGGGTYHAFVTKFTYTTSSVPIGNIILLLLE